MQGKWLEELGFHIGDLMVEYGDGAIHICPAEPEACIMVCVPDSGYTAKTVTSISQGIGLAREGRRVLMVDMDPQGSMTATRKWDPPPCGRC